MGNTDRLFTPVPAGVKTMYLAGGMTRGDTRLWIIVGPKRSDRITVHLTPRDLARLHARLWPTTPVRRASRERSS
jgi:hypothetical protein